MKNKNEIAKIGGLIISVTLIILITLLCVINPPIYSTDILSNEEEYKIEDESIVQFVETKDITSEEDKKLDGGPVYINYIFKGLKEGKTTITFKYVNITDGSIEKEDKVTVKVDKYKNISLIAIP